MIRQTLTQDEIDGMVTAMGELGDGSFELTAPDGYDSDEPDSLGDLDTNEFIDDSRDDWEELESDDGHLELYEDDGQPTEYEEWQDVYGGDDWDHGQYDEC
tara:strand:+ start:170 stop:472 length:303 start_codon:yes stop_codon:yes gene_type:complete